MCSSVYFSRCLCSAIVAFPGNIYYSAAVSCDFQQCGILTSVDSDEPVQSPFKLRNSKWCSVSSLSLINIQATSKGSDQTACMPRLI